MSELHRSRQTVLCIQRLRSATLERNVPCQVLNRMTSHSCQHGVAESAFVNGETDKGHSEGAHHDVKVVDRQLRENRARGIPVHLCEPSWGRSGIMSDK